MTILVTGAGLIGASFAREAIARGERVVFFDPEPRAAFLDFKLGKDKAALIRGDVRDLAALLAAVKTHRPETIVHTAGLIGGRVQQAMSTAFDVNLGGVRSIAECMRLEGVRRLVHISTFGVYDTRRPAPAAIAEDFPRGAGRGYGNFKVAQEAILEAYADLYGFELIVLRPANVYGYGHFWSGSSGGAKMQALAEAALSGRAARFAAADAVANEYVYARDVGRAVDLAVTTPRPAQIFFNIGTGVVTPFDVVLAAIRRLRPTLTCEIEPGPASKAKAAPLSLVAAEQGLGWRPAFDLEAGFADFLEELEAARASSV